MATRRNSKVVVETVATEVPEVTETVTETVEVPEVVEATEVTEPVEETVEDEDTSPLVSVAMSPCGYVARRANLGTFAVAYFHSRTERSKGGMVGVVTKTLEQATKLADRVNDTGVGINPADVPAWGGVVLPAYIIRASQVAEARKTLTWLYAAWLDAEAAFLNGQLVKSA